jgi:hypothetical protein
VSLARRSYPNGAKFAFTILDDTDVATVANVAPVYQLLAGLGLRTTKTVWPVGCPEGSRDFSSSETLDDEPYRRFVLELQQRGFEITWHGATMETSERARTVEALGRFKEVFGEFPRIHVNHALNRENVYWGVDRLDNPALRALFGRVTGLRAGHFSGQVPDSPYWWGDLCSEQIVYGRNLTFNDVDVMQINPTMPYRDPARPLVRRWFSASDAEDANEFVQLLSPAAVSRLERLGGVCIVATHLGKGFVRDGEVDPRVRACLQSVASRRGWFPTVGTLLDWLWERRTSEVVPPPEWRRMQLRWARDLFVRKVRSRLKKKGNT